MDEFTPNLLGSRPPKSERDSFVSRILIPLGSVVIAAVVLLSTKNKLPSWASIIVVAYLAFVIVWIVARPTNNAIQKVVNVTTRRRFVKGMRPELHEILEQLDEMLEQQRMNTIPFVVADLSSKLSRVVKEPILIGAYQEQFYILQSWASSLTRSMSNYRATDFRRDSSELSQLVFRFTCACTSARNIIDNAGYVDKVPHDVRADWNAAVNRMSNFINRVEHFTKAVNAKYSTRICADSFQEVKPL